MTSGEWKLGRLNGFDFACLVLVLLCIAGFVLAKAGHAGVDQVITGTHKINIDLYFSGVKTKDKQMFKVGDNAALTIRNQPVYPPMKIVNVKEAQKQVSFLSPDGKSAVSFADPSVPLAHDFEVTVQDTADVTNDGYVVRGNKLKIGNQIELEGFKYRVTGVVTDINVADQ